jgi:hypothetical protein
MAITLPHASPLSVLSRKRCSPHSKGLILMLPVEKVGTTLLNILMKITTKIILKYLPGPVIEILAEGRGAG